MIKRLFIIFILTICFLGLAFVPAEAMAEQEDFTCAVYFTGVGCAHCAKTDPVILKDLLKKYPNLVVIEYEIYQQKENGPLISQYNDNYGSGLSIPLIIFSQDKYLVGDRLILQNIKRVIEESVGNKCPLINSNSQCLNNLDLATLPGNPKFWTNDRILIKINQEDKWIFGWNGQPIEKQQSKDIINYHDVWQKLIRTEDISATVSKVNYDSLSPIAVPLSGQNIRFDNAIEFIVNQKREEAQPCQTLALPKILSLAAVDAVNPCALAVLILMLLAILTYNPRSKKDILLAGLAFVFSVFIMYLFYGLVIIRFFQLIQALTSIRFALYKILGGLAIILGVLNIKDFVRYKPGGPCTEMPMFMRPKVKKIISGITSPRGAFIVGAFVTVFLLPCTIGPYVIAGGILSAFGVFKIFPCLLLYNLIFVLPMLAVTYIVYLGIAKVQDVSGWKDKNIRYLHLISGLIILGLGVAMLLGLV